MYAFLYTARRKHDRKDEPSKIPLIRKTGDIPILVLSFLLIRPSGFIGLFHSSGLYLVFMTALFFFFFLPFVQNGNREHGGEKIAAAAL